MEAIRLKGSFERHRYGLVVDAIKDEVEEENGELIKLFNTHGNTAIDIKFKLNDRYCYGLQWQAKALKLFLEDCQFNNRNDQRDTVLQELAEKELQESSGNNPVRLNRNGRFRSVTLRRWDVMQDISGRATEIKQMLSFLRKHREDLIQSVNTL